MRLQGEAAGIGHRMEAGRRLARRWARYAAAPVVQAWNRLSAKVRDLSLPAAAALTILGLVAAAVLVLWLTGRPEGGEWWDFHTKTLEWKDRLTISGAVAAGAGAAIALVVSYRKQRDAEGNRSPTPSPPPLHNSGIPHPQSE